YISVTRRVNRIIQVRRHIPEKNLRYDVTPVNLDRSTRFFFNRHSEAKTESTTDTETRQFVVNE
ncbi:hypothetical protein, partial [Escherichia coli]|uniref:hypothetical protein n=1 Tax=Escherichia coli TaxID=562 RepID=UPI001BC864F8